MGVRSMRDFAKQFYTSQAWKKCRESYTKKARGLCEVCLAKGYYVPGEIVHHKVHITPQNISDPSVTLNYDNLQLVCRECHAEIHGRKKRRYTIDAQGRVSCE